MTNRAWITIGDDQMALAWFDLNAWSQFWRELPCGIDQPASAEGRPIGQTSIALSERNNCFARMQRCAQFDRSFQKKGGSCRRIYNGIPFHQESSRKELAKIWLGFMRSLRVEDFF